MVHGCMVYTERAETAAVSCGTGHASAVSTYTTSVDIQKRAVKNYSHSYRITRERSEPARKRLIALYKSDQQTNGTSVQELCESRGGRPGLSILMSLTVSVDVKQR